jgi:hypothetical protein
MRSLRVYLVLISAIAAGLFTPSCSFAGWISTQNETKGTITIQEVHPGPLPQRGKAIKLLPGEVCREFCPIPSTERRFQVWDPRQPRKLLFDGKVTCPAGDMLFRVVCESNTIKVIPVSIPPKK